MRLIKQLKLLTFQVIVSLIFLNTQISFAQKAEMPKASIQDWKGFYAGVIAETNKTTVKNKIAFYCADYQPDTNSSFNEAGLKVGYNFLIENFIIGIEGKKTFYDSNKLVCMDPFPSTLELYCLKNGNYQSLILKAGIPFDQFLVYSKAGFVEKEFKQIGYYDFNLTPDPDMAVQNHTFNGDVWGFGIDYMYAKNFIVGFEFEAQNFKDKTLMYGGPNTLSPNSKIFSLSGSYKF